MQLTVDLNGEEIAKDYDQVCRHVAELVHVPGFRHGKVPLTLIKKRYASQIRKELSGHLAPKYFVEGTEREKIRPISPPLLDRFDMEDNGSTHMEISFEVLPSVDITGYKGMRVDVPHLTVSEEEIQEGLHTIQLRMARHLPVEDRPAQKGDFLSVDLKGKLVDGSGIEFQDRSLSIELGGEGALPGFTDNLIGTKPSETRTFDVSYPSDYENKRLAGKTVQYEINILAVRERRLPPLDDELAREFGEHQTLEELRGQLSEQIQSTKDREREDRIQDRFMEELLKRFPFEPPESMVGEALQEHLVHFSYNLRQQGVDPERAGVNWRKIAEESRPRAMERARSHVILDIIAVQENLEVSEEELEEEIRNMASGSGKTIDAFRANLQKENQMETLRQQLRRRKTRQLLRRHAIAE